MIPEKDKDPDFINKEETKLYSASSALSKLELHPLKGTSFKTREPFSLENVDSKNNAFKRASFAKKFFLVSLFILITALTYTAYRLFFSESREDFISKHIDIVMETAPFSKGGEPLQLAINVVNRNNVALKNVHLEIEYPRGSESALLNDFEHIRMDLPDINPGEKYNKNMTLVLYGEKGSIKNIKATLEYTLPDSTLSYTKIADLSLTISSSPIVLDVDAPTEVSPNQIYTIRLRISQNTKSLPAGSLVSIVFPRDFVVESMSRKPTFDVGTWAITTEKEGDYEDITVTGRFNSQEGDERSFRFFAGIPPATGGTNIETSYVSRTHVVSLTRPILDAYILLGLEKGKVIAVNPGTSVQGEIIYRNRQSTAVIDPVFHLHIAGSALNKFSISPADGFYDSGKSEIFWDKNTNDSLAIIPPGAEGHLMFTFSTLNQNTESSTVVKEPTVNFSLSFSGIKDDISGVVQNLENIETATVRVTTEPTIFASNVYASGARPPTVEKESVYQINLTVKNTHNDITGGKLTAKIPFYVKWVGKVTKDEKITYNPDTREVTWSLGNVAIGAGNTTAARNASIQVSIIPSLSQLDSTPDILQNIRFIGTDLFSNKDVKATYPNVTIETNNDSSTDDIIVQ